MHGRVLVPLLAIALAAGASLLNTEAFWQLILKGAILSAAVAVDMAGRRGR